MTTTTKTTLINNRYLASDDTIAEIARNYSAAQGTIGAARGEYLRILIAHTQELVGRIKDQSVEAALGALSAVHDRLYNIILHAVTTPDVEPDDAQPKEERSRRALERNRRSTFARSSKSTVVAFVKSGGKLMELGDLDEITKERLRELTKPKDPPQRVAVGGIESKLEQAVTEMAAANREEAIDFIDKLHTKLMLLVARPLTELAMRRGNGELTFTSAH